MNVSQMAVYVSTMSIDQKEASASRGKNHVPYRQRRHNAQGTRSPNVNGQTNHNATPYSDHEEHLDVDVRTNRESNKNATCSCMLLPMPTASTSIATITKTIATTRTLTKSSCSGCLDLGPSQESTIRFSEPSPMPSSLPPGERLCPCSDMQALSEATSMDSLLPQESPIPSTLATVIRRAQSETDSLPQATAAAAGWNRIASYTSAAPAQATGFVFLANLGDERKSGTFD